MKLRSQPVLIVAPPGRLRDGLQAMVRAVPQIADTVQADDGPTALQMLTEHPLALVLLDADLPGEEAWTVLPQIKARWPQTRCIVLINNDQQRQIANTHCADAVLVKGFPGTTLLETVAKLLLQIGQVTGSDGPPSRI
jgi:DNA-binding NarL/FixJ family response regulator